MTTAERWFHHFFWSAFDYWVVSPLIRCWILAWAYCVVLVIHSFILRFSYWLDLVYTGMDLVVVLPDAMMSWQQPSLDRNFNHFALQWWFLATSFSSDSWIISLHTFWSIQLTWHCNMSPFWIIMYILYSTLSLFHAKGLSQLVEFHCLFSGGGYSLSRVFSPKVHLNIINGCECRSDCHCGCQICSWNLYASKVFHMRFPMLGMSWFKRHDEFLHFTIIHACIYHDTTHYFDKLCHASYLIDFRLL